MMGALFVKHWRVGQIFQQVKSGRAMGVVKITNGDVAKRVALLVALDVVVIGIWMGADARDRRRGQTWSDRERCTVQAPKGPARPTRASCKRRPARARTRICISS